MTAAKLAERTGTRPHNITKLVDRMKKDGLVATERGEEDRRFVHVRLTSEGHSLLTRAMPAAKRTVSRIMATISEYDLAELLRLLSIMKQNAKVREARMNI